MANPEAAPKIDWATYKAKIPVAGLADTFQKNYEGLKIAYPTENVSSQIDAQEKEVLASLQSLAKETAERAASYKAEISRIEALIPYSEMTLEEFYLAHPEQAIDTYKKPTYWPHTPEEQLDYVPKEPPQESAH